MTISIHFWLRCLLWAVFGLATLSAIIIAAKERLRVQLESGKPYGGWRRAILVITGERVTQQASKVIAFSLGVLVGCLGLQVWQYGNHQTLSNVLILRRWDDHNYRLQTDHGQAFNVRLCPESEVDWNAGEKLQVLSYEQRSGCKTIVGRNLGFVAYTDDNGNRSKFNIENEEVSDVR